MLFMVLFLSIQPFSLSSGDDNSALATQTDDCSCSNKSELKVKSSGKFKNNKVLNSVKSTLDKEYKNNKSTYKKNDFDWKSSEFVSFGQGKDGLLIPSKKNSSKEDIRLITAYEKKTGKVDSFILMVSTLEDNEMNVVYTTLNGEKIVGLDINAQTNEIEDKSIYNEQESTILSMNKASAGYGSDVVKCLKTKWKTANSFTKTVCTGACSSVVFGGNAIGATVCASCLGAYAMVCLLQ